MKKMTREYLEKLIQEEDYGVAFQELKDYLGIKIEAQFSYNGPYFDERFRDVYDVTITRGRRSMAFQFGQSVSNSRRYKLTSPEIISVCGMDGKGITGRHSFPSFDSMMQTTLYAEKKFIEGTPPCDYDILASIPTDMPDTFKEFCWSFDYNDDSIKAKEIYDKTKEIYRDVCYLFSDEEIELISMIQ